MISYVKAFLLIGITFYMASIYGSTSLALLSFAEIAFVVLSLVVVLYERMGVKCTLKVPISMAQQGQQVKVLLSKTKNGKPWRGRVRVVLTIQNTCLEQKKCIRQSISGASQAAFYLTLENAGNYEISIRRIRVYDLSGLFYLTKKSVETASVVVLPTFYPVNIRLTEAVRNFVGDSEVYDTVRSGDDASETFKLRPFQDGDKLKNIHWKLSAKMEELIVRENSMPKACSTVLFLDNGFLGKKTKTDAFIRAAASLSYSMMDMDCPHYMAWYSRRYQDLVRMRVDNEESFYEFLLYLLQDFERTEKVNLGERYREKYGAEMLLHRLMLKQNLKLYQQDLVVAELKSDDLEKSLSEMELIL